MTPEESDDDMMQFYKIENFEEKILNGLLQNYQKAIEFFINQKDMKQVKLAQ